MTIEQKRLTIIVLVCLLVYIIVDGMNTDDSNRKREPYLRRVS